MRGHNHVTSQWHMDPYMQRCGCHSAGSEEWLPERSWQQEMRTEPQVDGIGVHRVISVQQRCDHKTLGIVYVPVQPIIYLLFRKY